MQQVQIEATNSLTSNINFGFRMTHGFQRAAAMWNRQRQRRALLDLDDHQLSDIGKSRQEVLEEARKPFWK